MHGVGWVLGILGSKERGVVLVMSQAAAGVETSL